MIVLEKESAHDEGQFLAIPFGTVIDGGNDIIPVDVTLDDTIVAVNQWGAITWRKAYPERDDGWPL